MSEKHRHKFVPVEIHWKSVWNRLEKGKPPQPLCIVLACRCGAIKLVPAKIVYGGSLAVRNYKKMEKTKK